MKKARTIDIRLLDHTIPAFDTLTRSIHGHGYTHYWLKGGRGSTKSSFIGFQIPVLMISNPDVNGLVLRKVGNVLKDSVYNQILWAIGELRLSGYFRAIKNPLEITYLPTGQKIYFRGADDPLKIKSITPERGYIGITWFEELDQFRGEDEVRSILQSANRGGSVYWNFYSFNPPKSRDNWANIAVQYERPDKVVTSSTYLDVPVSWLGEQFIVEAEDLKRRNETAYRHEYLGEATGTGGAVFENIEERKITDEEISSFGYFYYGVDFGFAIDPFVWIKLSYDSKRKILYILDEIYAVSLSNSRAVGMIKQRQNAGSIITADSAEPRTINEFCALGLNVIGAKKGPDSVDHGVTWLQHLERIVIDRRRTPNAYREFAAYEYDRDRYGNFISRFPDKDNHTIDAARYALESIIGQRVVKIGSRKALGI